MASLEKNCLRVLRNINAGSVCSSMRLLAGAAIGASVSVDDRLVPCGGVDDGVRSDDDALLVWYPLCPALRTCSIQSLATPLPCPSLLCISSFETRKPQSLHT